MKTSKAGVELIKRFEGCRLTVYLDPVGIPTVGYGHTAGLNKSMVGMPITQGMADAYLVQDLERFEKKVDKYDPIYHWSDNERAALISFAFNVGSIDGLTNNGKRNRAEIGTKILQYNKAGGAVLAGLTKRRKAEHDLFLTSSTQSSTKSITEIAREVIADKWGKGEERKRRLKEAGYDYAAVQAEVNKLLK